MDVRGRFDAALVNLFGVRCRIKAWFIPSKIVWLITVFIMLCCVLCVLDMSRWLDTRFSSPYACFEMSKPKVTVVILRNGVALTSKAWSSSVQICEISAWNGHELSLHTLLICLESLRWSPGSVTPKENFVELSHLYNSFTLASDLGRTEIEGWKPGFGFDFWVWMFRVLTE